MSQRPAKEVLDDHRSGRRRVGVRELFLAVERRFEDEEPLDGVEHFRVAATRKRPAEESGTASKIVEERHMAKVARSDRERRIRSKVADMRTKNLATGARPELHEDERLYLNVRIWGDAPGGDGGSVHHRFFPNAWTLGRAETDITEYLRTFGLLGGRASSEPFVLAASAGVEELGDEADAFACHPRLPKDIWLRDLGSALPNFADVWLVPKDVFDDAAAEAALHFAQLPAEGKSADADAPAAAPAPAPAARTFAAGDSVMYVNAQTDSLEEATVLAVHYDDDPPYYTIRLSPDREKQTVAEKLVPREEHLAGLREARAGRPVAASVRVMFGREVVVAELESADGSVADLKAALYALTGVAAARQKLLCAGKVLADGLPLADSGVLRAGAKVRLMGRPG